MVLFFEFSLYGWYDCSVTWQNINIAENSSNISPLFVTHDFQVSSETIVNSFHIWNARMRSGKRENISIASIASITIARRHVCIRNMTSQRQTALVRKREIFLAEKSISSYSFVDFLRWILAKSWAGITSFESTSNKAWSLRRSRVRLVICGLYEQDARRGIASEEEAGVIERKRNSVAGELGRTIVCTLVCNFLTFSLHVLSPSFSFSVYATLCRHLPCFHPVLFLNLRFARFSNWAVAKNFSFQ